MLKTLFKLVVFSIILVLGSKLLLLAAESDTFQITVSVNRALSVNVTTGTADGATYYNVALTTTSLPTNYSLVISTPLSIWNDSPQNAASIQNYSLQLTGDTSLIAVSSWTTTGSGIVDRYIVAGVFTNDSSVATINEFSADNIEDVIATSTARSWTATTVFSPATPSFRYSTETSHPRDNLTSRSLRLWIGIATPSAVSSTGASNYNITVTVTAL